MGKLIIVNGGGYIGTKPEVTTYVEPLLPTGIKDQKKPKSPDKKEIEHFEDEIPILPYPGICMDCE